MAPRQMVLQKQILQGTDFCHSYGRKGVIIKIIQSCGGKEVSKGMSITGRINGKASRGTVAQG